jgi:type VI secretion system protein ImpJ
MFLGPQHLQAAARYEAQQRQRSARRGLRYYWGLESLVLNQPALANHRLEIRSLIASLPDGTLLHLPEDGPLPTLDLKAPLESERSLTVFLALPSFQLDRANASETMRAEAGGQGDGARYRVEAQDLPDENTGLSPEAVRVRLYNVRLLLAPPPAGQVAEQGHPGYDTLPIAQVEKAPDADATPRLDLTYIPPLLACDAWAPLQVGILRTIYDRIGTKIDLLAGQVRSRGIGVESHATEDTRIIGQLRALNEAHALLGILAFAEGIHPLQAYLELCRLVGQLSIFREERRPPDLPRYDHDDLGYCFYQVKKYIDALLDLFIEPDWIQRPFQGAGLRMQVSLEPSWLESAWQVFVGVQSPLPPEQCVGLFTTPGVLDMKIGSSNRVDTVYERGEAGLKFTHRLQPRALPAVPGLIFFQVARDVQPAEWQHVQRSLTLAIRLNEHKIAGNIQGEQTLTIRHGGQTIPLTFTLYVVRPSTAPATEKS